jgi:Domain of unknown function DUF29
MNKLEQLLETDGIKSLFEADEHAWLIEQIELLKMGELDKIDKENLLTYLTEMTIAQRNALRSYFRVLLMHILKWEFQPERRSRSWSSTINNCQDQIEWILQDAPSINQYIPSLYADAYPKARRAAAIETGKPRSTFPASNPYTVEEAMSFNRVDD